MRCRLTFVFLFMLTLALAATASASPLASTQPAKPSVVEQPKLVPDPYVDRQDFTSKAEPVTFCPCQPGINCCLGDDQGSPCGAPVGPCHCDAFAKCRHD